MATDLQGSSRRPRAVGFRLRNRKDFIYETDQAAYGRSYHDLHVPGPAAGMYLED